jgi:hypothetical protein
MWGWCVCNWTDLFDTFVCNWTDLFDTFRSVPGGGQAHSVRRESCNADSSPEPAASLSGGGEFGGEGREELGLERVSLLGKKGPPGPFGGPGG